MKCQLSRSFCALSRSPPEPIFQSRYYRYPVAPLVTHRNRHIRPPAEERACSVLAQFESADPLAREDRLSRIG